MPSTPSYDTLSSTVKKAFVLSPPASLIPYTERFWVIKEDEPEPVTDGRHNYLCCGFGELALLVLAHGTDALTFRVPPVKGRKRSITVDKHTWDRHCIFTCGITAIPIQENENSVINGGFTAAFCITDNSGAAVVQMVPDRHYTVEISELLSDTASQLLLLLQSMQYKTPVNTEARIVSEKT